MVNIVGCLPLISFAIWLALSLFLAPYNAILNIQSKKPCFDPKLHKFLAPFLASSAEQSNYITGLTDEEINQLI